MTYTQNVIAGETEDRKQIISNVVTVNIILCFGGQHDTECFG